MRQSFASKKEMNSVTKISIKLSEGLEILESIFLLSILDTETSSA
jgi:hypothetical protein